MCWVYQISQQLKFEMKTKGQRMHPYSHDEAPEQYASQAAVKTVSTPEYVLTNMYVGLCTFA